MYSNFCTKGAVIPVSPSLVLSFLITGLELLWAVLVPVKFLGCASDSCLGMGRTKLETSNQWCSAGGPRASEKAWDLFRGWFNVYVRGKGCRCVYSWQLYILPISIILQWQKLRKWGVPMCIMLIRVVKQNEHCLIWLEESTMVAHQRCIATVGAFTKYVWWFVRLSLRLLETYHHWEWMR